jgi:hypothetical protein
MSSPVALKPDSYGWSYDNATTAAMSWPQRTDAFCLSSARDPLPRACPITWSAQETDTSLTGVACSPANGVSWRVNVALFPEEIGGETIWVETRRFTPLSATPPLRMEMPFFMGVAAAEVPDIVIPGCWYGDNHPDDGRHGHITYPRGFGDHHFFRLDATTTPGIAFSSRGSRWAIAWEKGWPSQPATDTAHIGSVGYRRDPVAGWSCVFSYPSLQSPHTYRRLMQPPGPPESCYRPYAANEEIVLTFFHFPVSANEAPVTRMVRHAFRNEEAKPRVKLSPWFSSREAAFLGLEVVEAEHWREGMGYQHKGRNTDVGHGNGPIPDIYTGWCGGTIASLAADALENSSECGEEVRRRVPLLRQHAAEQDAFFIAHARNVHGMPRSSFRDDPTNPRWCPSAHFMHLVKPERDVHIRCPLECLLFLALLAEAEAARGIPPVKARMDFIASGLRVVLGSLRSDGELPLVYDDASGAPSLWQGSTQGGWAAVLAMAAGLFQTTNTSFADHCREAAVRVGTYYADKAAASGRFCGGVPDAGFAPNAEDPWLLLCAFAKLHELTGDARWLGPWKQTADYFATWCYSHEVRFDPDTPLAQQKFSSFALPINSACNTFLCMWPVIAVPWLYQLSALTGDAFYARLAAAFMIQGTQMIDRGDGAIYPRKGAQSEQWYPTNHNSFGRHRERITKGDFWVDSVAFPRFAYAYAYADIVRRFGSLTVFPATRELVSLEAAEVRAVEWTLTSVTLELANPHPFELDLVVRILGQDTPVQRVLLPAHSSARTYNFPISYIHECRS